MEKKIQLNYSTVIHMNWLESIRLYKVSDTPLLDYIGTVLLCMVISYFSRIPVTLITIILLILSIPMHYAFHVSTSTTRYLDSLFVH